MSESPFSFARFRGDFRYWLLPYAGEHGYREVADGRFPVGRFKVTRWVAYWLWRLV